jgi:hypothetical protein
MNVILNRATNLPPKKEEAGTWRSLVTLLSSMRAQIDALSTSVSGVEVMATKVQMTADELGKLEWAEIKIGGKSYLLPMASNAD